MAFELRRQDAPYKPVRRLAYRLPSSVDAEALESDACLGLMKAARAFDPARGVRFRTYAAKRIRGQMLDGIRDRTACRRRVAVPRFLSMERVVGKDDDDRFTTLGETLAADAPPVGHAAEAADEARSVLRRLDAGSRRQLTEHHVEGLPQKELAASLGITPSAMCLRMKRIRALAREVRCADRR